MSQVRKPSGTSAPRGVVYDLAERRRQVESANQAAKADEAGVSENARELSRAASAVNDASEVRAERIAALKAQIESGKYSPDPGEVAKRLLERGF